MFRTVPSDLACSVLLGSFGAAAGVHVFSHVTVVLLRLRADGTTRLIEAESTSDSKSAFSLLVLTRRAFFQKPDLTVGPLK